MPKTFQLNIVLPETPTPARTVAALDIPADSGRITLLANHQPIIAAIRPGLMTITLEDGTREQWTLSAGALQMEHNTATLLVREAMQRAAE